MVDRATILGLALLLALLGWVVFAGAGTAAGAFWQGPSLAFVVGGAIIAGLISSPAVSLRRLMGILRNAFIARSVSPEDTIITLVAMAEIARRDGLLALDKSLAGLPDGFTRRGMQMAIDGMDREVIEAVMHAELESIDLRHNEGKAVLESMARFSPAFGMMGTLIGLVSMLGKMDDPSRIGPGMAVALLTTLYGLGLANLICLPLSRRLAYRSSQELLAKTIALKGVLGIHSGDNPRVLAGKLRAHLPAGGEGHNFQWFTVPRPDESQHEGTELSAADRRATVSVQPQARPMLDEAGAKKLAQKLEKMIKQQKRFVDAA